MCSYLTYPELGALLFPEAELGGINFVGGSLYVGICATSLGVSAAYFDFIAATMHTVVPDLSEDIWKLVRVAHRLLLARCCAAPDQEHVTAAAVLLR